MTQIDFSERKRGCLPRSVDEILTFAVAWAGFSDAFEVMFDFAAGNSVRRVIKMKGDVCVFEMGEVHYCALNDYKSLYYIKVRCQC